MKTIVKSGMWKILKLFYENKNKKLHLREISRQIKLNESSVYLHLNSLVKDKIMNFEMEGNLKKFSINKNNKWFYWSGFRIGNGVVLYPLSALGLL